MDILGILMQFIQDVMRVIHTTKRMFFPRKLDTLQVAAAVFMDAFNPFDLDIGDLQSCKNPFFWLGLPVISSLSLPFGRPSCGMASFPI